MATTPTATAVDPAMLSGAAALVISALLLLLYFYRKRHYILFWTAGWLFAAAARFVVVPPMASEQLRAMAYGVSQLLAIGSALLFVLGADAYTARPRFRRFYGMMILPVALWFTLAPLALGRSAAFAPGHTLIAGALAAASFAHIALLRRARLFGAIAIASSLLGLAVSNLWIALGVQAPEAAVSGPNAYLTLGFYLVAALGMQLMTFEDMTYELRVTNRDLEAAQSELRDLVTTDPLTGCRNRRFFDEVIGRELERHRRYHIPLSLLFIDVNRFKAINDALGHEAGDRVLQQVAAFLMRHVREADYVFRWGGDEFLILISCTQQEARRKGAELQAAFARSSRAAALPDGVGLSVGCTQVPPETRDIVPLVKEADDRMYAEKKKGRVTEGVRGKG